MNGKKWKKEMKGITLIALVITIIVLLILAGVSIATLTGDNGILTQASNAKEATEKGSEKEQLQLAMTSMEFENEKDILKKKSIFQTHLDTLTGNGKTIAYANEEGYTVQFIDSKRVYTIEKNGTIIEEDISILEADDTPGILDGSGTSEDEPYVVMSIEDLVEWSKNYNMYTNSYIILGKTLNFKSELSYANSSTTEYNSFFGVDGNVPLFEILTNKDYAGFIPIAKFNGIFDAQGYNINNIYINSSLELVGLFGKAESSSVIKNLSISGEFIQNSTNRWSCVGGIVGEGTGRIEFCNNSCNINKSFSSTYGCGGISGYYGGTIYCCANNGTIKSAGLAGGITGTGTATIINCYNKGRVTVSGEFSASGINGGGYWSWKSNIYNCYNIGNITCEAQSIYARSAGIYGYMQNNITSLNIVNCWNTGILKSGGIIGAIRTITPNVLNCSYIETGPNQTSIAKPYSQSYMQSQDFINELNNYIESNEDGIDTKGWAKWIQVDGEYPTLDFHTIWDGEKWVTSMK